MIRKHLLAFLLILGTAHTYAVAQTRVLGADLSMLPAYEQAQVPYMDSDGVAQSDPLLFFRDEAGIRCVRVRLFVNPTKETGVIQDLDYVKTFGARIKAAGMKFMLDFHYSDTWADPAQQKLPAGWPTTVQEVTAKLYEYTSECLAALKAEGATPDYIQLGNEISYGMCGIKVHVNSDNNWDTFRAYLNAAAKACREQCPEAKLIIHTERTGQWSVAKATYERLASVDYDIIGLSYYPIWHNSLSVLGTTLNGFASSFPTKNVMIVETGYNNAWYPADATYNVSSTYPATPAGQQKFVEALITELLKHSNVTGLFYWFPEENPYENHVYEPWVNRGLFNNGYGDEWPNGHHALPAFYSLKKYTEGQPDEISLPTTDAAPSSSTSKAYDLSGRPVGTRHQGIVIQDGKKRFQERRE
ncbi:MAG: arabinogalactan endo-1,4-beta-galactosidase [Bacteroidales bacterium]|nr:arabinogalactan endo-1,4-beta-galactosidase [Bacteroidales bacterium]